MSNKKKEIPKYLDDCFNNLGEVLTRLTKFGVIELHATPEDTLKNMTALCNSLVLKLKNQRDDRDFLIQVFPDDDFSKVKCGHTEHMEHYSEFNEHSETVGSA